MDSRLPQCTLEQYETEFAGRHLLHGVLAKWARKKPDEAALIHHNRKATDTWATLENESTALAMQLLRLGFGKGDFLATSLPFLRELILLEYACFKIGVIHAPLDLRLSPEEVIRCLTLIGAKGFVFPGKTRAADFRELGRAVAGHCPFVGHLIQMSAPEKAIEGARSFASFAAAAAGKAPDDLHAAYRKAVAAVGETDAAQVIFTTGSTGAPKPALLSHRSITCQNMCLGTAFGFDEGTRFLVNFPPSHVAGQAETLMTTLFHGGTVVLLELFDAAASLKAIEQHRVSIIGQIPAMFHLEWRLAGYENYDLSSLRFAAYGGQQVPVEFLRKMAGMAPRIGTGLGLTEASGFCTYTVPGASVDEIAESIGYSMPVYPLSIRKPMREDGSAGGKLPDGEIGAICFEGPQTFSGYAGDPEATRRTISTDGVLYTGDLGYTSEKGLHFAGRSKWVIKSSGYQVFPAEVEKHFCALAEKVAACGVVGVTHRLLGEGIVAFIEKHPGADLNPRELKAHARRLTGYMRPLHYVILAPGQLPLNRAAKTDYVRLAAMAREAVGEKWSA